MSESLPISLANRTLAERIQAEYDDQPSLRLTPSQAQRLFAGTPQETAVTLARLVADGILQRLPDGQFVRTRRATVIDLPAIAAGNRWWIRSRHRRFSGSVALRS